MELSNHQSVRLTDWIRVEESARCPEYPLEDSVVEDDGGRHAELEEVDSPDHGEQAETQNNGGEYSEVEEVILHPVHTEI